MLSDALDVVLKCNISVINYILLQHIIDLVSLRLPIDIDSII